jgi:hypothetical protein
VDFKGTAATTEGDTTKAFEGFVYVDRSCTKVTINSRMPVNRAGHTVVSTGSEALVCGGYYLDGENTVFVGSGKDLECWWFTPLPYPRFDPLNVSFTLESGTPIPSARWGHTMSYDSKLRNVLLFGGSANATIFNDCWALMLSGGTHSMHDRSCSTDRRFSLAFNSRHNLQLSPSILAGPFAALLSLNRQ